MEIKGVNYSSGESDADQSRQDFSQMDKMSKREHILELWRLAYMRAVAANSIKLLF